MNYSDQLRDPRWQRRRLEIMSRANFACEQCGDTKTTLNVHHKLYRRGALPWEYTDVELVCWCDNCHEREHGIATDPPGIRRGRQEFDSDAAYLSHLREWLLRKAEYCGLNAAEKSVLADVLQMRTDRAA